MRAAYFFACASIATAFSAVLLVSSQHRARLIVGSFQAIDSLADLSPSEPFRFIAPITDTGVTPSFDSIIRQLTLFEAAHPVQNGDALPALDDPDTCEKLLLEGKAIHCYNADIGICAMLAREHVHARLWDVTGPKQLGGNGHNLLEVFDHGSDSWKALDPYYHCYFTLTTDTLHPLSVPEFRLAVLKDPRSVQLHAYAPVPGHRPDSIVIEEFRELAPCAMLHANNDFRARYTNRYGMLMPFASTFDKLPLRVSRGIRTVMLGSSDRRYIIEDSHSPHYHYVSMKWLFWSVVALSGTFFTLAIISWNHARKKPQRSAR